MKCPNCQQDMHPDDTVRYGYAGPAHDSSRCIELLQMRLRGADARNALLEAFGQKVNAIRDSMVSLQALNWSEHIYPLVVGLDAAGFEGKPYPADRANYGTAFERLVILEAALEIPCKQPDQCDSACKCCQLRFHARSKVQP